jgi:arsenite-transporting ATPase
MEQALGKAGFSGAQTVLEGLLASAPRFIFFTGKGGVGKTSTAAAAAIGLADAGRHVLLVSTDPASNLDEVLGVSLSGLPKSVPGVPGLDAMNIDPMAAAATYRERVVGPYRGVLPNSAVASIEEQLSGACAVEIAAFDEFTTLLADPDATQIYDHVLFDTAPTGHTLRLLSLPQAWSSFIDTNTLGTSCIGPLSGLSNQQERYRLAVATLADSDRSVLILVARPDPLAIGEAARAAGELRALGIANQRLVLNGVFRPTDSTDALALALGNRMAASLESLPGPLADLERYEIPLLPWSLVGLPALRALLSGVPQARATEPTEGPRGPVLTTRLEGLLDVIESRARGLVLTMGKGGVGKTTLAAAIAIELAQRGNDVELTTTDPAAHLDAVLGSKKALESGSLEVSRIDPEQVTAAYSANVLASAGSGLDEGARAVLEEDLRSPCTAEIAVFSAFARTVANAKDHFVVIDTAPTGHTLLLLDAARSYHREVGRRGGTIPPEVEELLDRLADPNYTSVLIVTIPEATPIHEAAALQEDLRRAGIEPAAWIVNQSLSASVISDPVLVARAAIETQMLNEVASNHAARLVLVPMLSEAPTGLDGLSRLFNQPAAAGTRA